MKASREKKGRKQPPPAITITIGADGRVMFHDLPAELLAVAGKLCPRDKGLKRRRKAAQGYRKGRP